MQNNNLIPLIEQIKKNHYFFLAAGVLLIIGALLVFSNLIIATLATMFILAGFLIAIGITQLIQSFYLKQTSLFFLTLIWAIIYIAVGIYIFIFPLQTSEVLTLFLAFLLVFFGMSRLFSWFMIRKLTGSFWLALTAITNIVLGLLIIAGWPSNSLILFGFFLGVDLLIQGFCFIMMSMAFRE